MSVSALHLYNILCFQALTRHFVLNNADALSLLHLRLLTEQDRWLTLRNQAMTKDATHSVVNLTLLFAQSYDWPETH